MWSKTRHEMSNWQIISPRGWSGYSGILNWFRHKACEFLIFYHCQFDHLSVKYCSQPKNDVFDQNCVGLYEILQKVQKWTVRKRCVTDRLLWHRRSSPLVTVHFRQRLLPRQFTSDTVYLRDHLLRRSSTFEIVYFQDRLLPRPSTFVTVHFRHRPLSSPSTSETVFFRDRILSRPSTFETVHFDDRQLSKMTLKIEFCLEWQFFICFRIILAD